MPHRSMQEERPSEAGSESTAHHPTQSEEDLLLMEAGYGHPGICYESNLASSHALSGSSSASSQPETESSTAASSSCHTGELVEEAASSVIPKYSMAAVRGRRQASVALIANIFANEEANIVWPHGFA